MPSLLATNDFPPKHGGIQSYLWELWRRLPADQVGVLTTSFEGDAAFDAEQPFPVVRVPQGTLLPTPAAARRIREQAAAWGASLAFLDPALPLGALGPRLGLPYVVVVHGSEVTVPRRLPGSHRALRRVLRRSAGIVAAGGFPAREAMRAAGRRLPGVIVPPGVDTQRFRPLDEGERRAARARLGLPADSPVVLGVSRLVPRKGFDVLIEAVAGLDGVICALGGAGRDRRRLEARARRAGCADRVRFLGRVPDDDLPALYGCADVFAMLCRNRWLGLEQEGFGIVFLEAAACGVPSVAGRSGGSHEAVVDGETGYVVDPTDAAEVRYRIADLLDDDRRHRFGARARARAQATFSYDVLAATLAPLARGDLDALTPLPLDPKVGDSP